MGRRITIDSATMLNKGLEIIEACRLFDLPPSAVKVTVHPQSTVHSLVEYIDGSILAQISVTDMRLPILYAMSYPERVESDLTFDMAALGHLDFALLISSDFHASGWPMRLRKGGAHSIALNAADEIAVEAFLERVIPFSAIPRTIEQVLEAIPDPILRPFQRCWHLTSRRARRRDVPLSRSRLGRVSLRRDPQITRLGD